MGELANSFIMAVAGSILGVFLFDLIQYTAFTDVVRNATTSTYEIRGLHLEVREIKEEYVSIFVREDETTCELKEMESCYSGCLQITVLDIKKEEADIQVRDDLLCEMKVAVDQFRRSLPVAKFFDNLRTLV
jgi:hypothetical protein